MLVVVSGGGGSSTRRGIQGLGLRLLARLRLRWRLLLVAACVSVRVEGLEGKFAVACFAAAAALRDVRIVAPHNLGLEDLQLSVDAFQFSLSR